MPSDEQILDQVRQAFAACPRPEHFTNYRHCDECAEHDDVLCSREVSTLTHDDVGNAGWDPICFVSPEGFAYYFPALARLALAEPHASWGWYGPQLLFHLLHDGPDNTRVQACTRDQRVAVASLLRHIVDTRAALADDYQCGHELLRAIEYWTPTPL